MFIAVLFIVGLVIHLKQKAFVTFQWVATYSLYVQTDIMYTLTTNMDMHTTNEQTYKLPTYTYKEQNK